MYIPDFKRLSCYSDIFCNQSILDIIYFISYANANLLEICVIYIHLNCKNLLIRISRINQTLLIFLHVTKCF
jgi:hypothetical protein